MFRKVKGATCRVGQMVAPELIMQLYTTRMTDHLKDFLLATH